MLKGFAFDIKGLQPFNVEGFCLQYKKASNPSTLKAFAFNIKGLQPFIVEGFWSFLVAPFPSGTRSRRRDNHWTNHVVSDFDIFTPSAVVNRGGSNPPEVWPAVCWVEELKFSAARKANWSNHAGGLHSERSSQALLMEGDRKSIASVADQVWLQSRGALGLVRLAAPSHAAHPRNLFRPYLGIV